jgi:hypothetical protein
MSQNEITSGLYNQELRHQISRRLCTVSHIDPSIGVRVWCQKPQHNRGKKKKCLACLLSSPHQNERLIAQGYCKCKQGHPVGRGCPDRYLLEGKAHLITEEQWNWYWKRLLTNDGRYDLNSREELSVEQEKHMRGVLQRWTDFILHPPPSMKMFYKIVRTIKTPLRVQRDWLIVIAVLYSRMWKDAELNLARRFRESKSQEISQGMLEAWCRRKDAEFEASRKHAPLDPT